jgi:SpoVK/Ycf46/Vps4 family AAA+-type ATPase
LLEQNKTAWAEKQVQLLSTLDKGSQDRYHNLARACVGIIQNAENNPGVQVLEGIRSGDLNQLLWIFLKLLNSRKKINQILSQTSPEQLDREIKGLTDKLTKESEGSPVFRSLQGTLEIQKRRLENFLKAEESFKVAESELDRIEKQVILITEETTVSSDPEVLSGRLEGVVQSLQGTTKWMTEHGEYFGSLDTEPVPGDLLVAPRKSEKV